LAITHIYQQTFIDTYTKVAFCKVYDRKNALVAADMLNDRVIPFFDAQGIPLVRILTDRGSEYCGNRPNRGNCDAGFPMDVFHLRMSDGGVIETLKESWDGKWLIYTTLMNKSDIEAGNYNNYHSVNFDNVYMLYVHSF
jgi:hypothetical protein